VKGKR